LGLIKQRVQATIFYLCQNLLFPRANSDLMSKALKTTA
jgi:hypothetical protein